MNAQQPWEPGVIARYLTVAGTADPTATVDVTRLEKDTRASCNGCRQTSAHSHQRMIDGWYSEYPKHDPEAADTAACDWAQAHAEKCRAMPRPAVTS